MASNTENLDLLMKNPSTDGADTFNVQTMLNENWQKIDNNAGKVAQTLANILKPTTPPIIGLPPSTTPDGMFQALGNTGELYVWRKTITSGTGTYSLGAVQEGLHYIKWANNSATSDSSGTFEYGSEIAVNNDGTITGIKNPSTITIKPWDDDASKANVFKGKFIKMISQVVTGLSRFEIGEIWWIPADAVMTRDLLNGQSDAWYIAASKRQQVIGVPAGTTTTYPVSTNPNAYQEGSDAKPAGYVLGDVVTGRFMLEGYFNSSHPTYYIADTKPTVTDDGVVSVNDVYGFNGYNGDKQQLQTLIRGKYIKCRVDDYTSSDFRNLGVVYIPEDTVVLQNSSVDGTYIDRYQPVTGYPAIPAGTTIEYLGRLGDKARVQVISYVGTGTYGSDHPNSLTFDFAPKFFAIMADDDHYGRNAFAIRGASYIGYQFDGNTQANSITWEGAKISWYSLYNAAKQYNVSGETYYAIAIG